MAGMPFHILLFIAFRIKDPAVSLVGDFGSLFSNCTSGNNSNQNSTIFEDVKVGNSNTAAFRFVAGETTIYHGTTVVRENEEERRRR
ncbi:hypothetical protein LINGRAHAP2_LOCUS31348 [Linum grandiflorum]